MVARAGEDDTDASPGQLLLEDIRDVLDSSFMSSRDVCLALNQLPEAAWGDILLTPHRLGQRLRPYGIKTRHSVDKTKRGYYRVDFEDAWKRYLPQKASKTVPAVPHCDKQPEQPDSVHAPQPSGQPKPSHENATSGPRSDTTDSCGQFSAEQAHDEVPRCIQCGKRGFVSKTTGRCGLCVAVNLSREGSS